MRKRLLYFLLNDAGETYDIDEDGNIITTPSPKPLQDDPDSASESALTYARNENYYGIVRSYAEPFRFVRKAKYTVDMLLAVYGVQAVANISIARYVNETMTYRSLFLSALNFATCKPGEVITDIQAAEGDLTALIKANENTTYEIAVDVPAAISVAMDGMILYSVVNALNYAFLTDDGSGGQTPDITFNRYVFIGMSISNTETVYPSLLWATTTSYRAEESLDYDPNDWLMQASDHVTARFQAENMRVNIAGAFTYRLGLYIRNGSSARQVDIIPSTPSTGMPTELSLTFDVSVPLFPGERVWMFFENDGGVGKGTSFPVDNTINITYDYRKDVTNVQCLRPLYVLQQLISKITNGKYTATSDLLSGDAANFVLTTGDALRGFRAGIPVDYAGPMLRTSLRSFFKSYNSRFNIGISNESNTAVLERKSRFFNNEIITDIGEIGEDGLSIEPATDYIFNTVKVGAPSQTYNDVNGRSEFNTTQTYTTPITKVTKELDLVSDYRTDAYGIEFTRINLENRTTTDSSSDNDLFMINIMPYGPGYILNRPDYTTLTGVMAGDSVFNVELSPKRGLIENGSFIHIGLDKLDDQLLKFETTDKNRALLTTLGGVTIVEQSDYLIGNLAPKLFLPYIFNITCKSPVYIVDLIEENPFGLLRFDYKGMQITGFILSISTSPANDEQQDYRLLAATGNNMVEIIKAINGKRS